LDAKLTDTPAGRPVEDPIPVPPVVVCVIFVRGVLIHKVGLEEATLTVFTGVTVMVPVAVALEQFVVVFLITTP
jgi:hypothetical protein